MPRPAPDPPDLTAALRSYLDHLVVERGRSSNTVAGYRRDLDRYVAHLSAAGRRRPDEVTAEDLAGFVSSVRRGDGERPPAAPASAARALAAVRGWHRFWAAEGWAVDVSTRQPSLRPADRLPRALAVEDVARLLEAPDRDTPVGLRDRALMETLYSTGARVSEVMALDVADVRSALAQPDETPFVLVTGKGGRQRYVPVGSRAREALDAYLVRSRPALAAPRGADASRETGPRATGRRSAARDGHALFLTVRGGRLTRQSAFAVLRSAALRAGLPGPASPHVLRHSFATHLVQGGADVRTVQELLGHASLATTQVYTRVTIETLREVYATSHPRARHPRPA